MKKYLLIPLSLASISAYSIHAGEVQDLKQAQLKQEAITIIKQFGGSLKPQLTQAMQTGGPVSAIEVCADTAPKIAKSLSKQTGWQVKRVSLKARNNEDATPDNWEQQVLKQFEQRNAKGENATKMTFSEVVDSEFRFMKAQGVEALCLTCHGRDIKPEIKAALDKHYPNDTARGYQQGQIRGAFSLTKKITPAS